MIFIFTNVWFCLGLKNLFHDALFSWKNFECEDCYGRKSNGPGMWSLPRRGEIWSAYHIVDISGSLSETLMHSIQWTGFFYISFQVHQQRINFVPCISINFRLTLLGLPSLLFLLLLKNKKNLLQTVHLFVKNLRNAHTITFPRPICTNSAKVSIRCI